MSVSLIDYKSIIERYTGKEVISSNINVNVWQSWYRGKVDNFHRRTLYNGENYIEVEISSLQMAKSVCEDWADCLGNEKLKVTLANKNDNEIIEELFRKNEMHVLINDAVEKTFALGNGAIVLGLEKFEVPKTKNLNEVKRIIPTKDTRITINFANSFEMMPLSISNKKITECAFISETEEFAYIAIHTKNEKGNYILTNLKVDKNSNMLAEDPIVIDTMSPNPWFFHLRPNINNNSFFYNDLGISIFANAIDVLKGIDEIYDAFVTEYVLSRKRVFIAEEAYKISVSPDGASHIRSFDPHDTLFFNIPKNQNDQSNHLIQETGGDIRYDAYINGLNTLLNLLSKKVGFGTERYKFDKSGIATATQIMSENSDFARSLRKQENLLKSVLTSMIFSIKYINNTFTKQPNFSDFQLVDINITFDDSIIEDENAVRERDRADVQAGLMSEVEYRIKHYGESHEDAKKNISDFFLYKELEKYINSLQQGVITPEDFVDKTYGVKKPELVEYIKEQLAKSELSNPMDLFEESSDEDDEKNKDDKAKDDAEDEKENQDN